MINGKYKRIIAYGCSFTAGDELADATVLGMPEEEVDEMKRSGATRQQLYGGLRKQIESHGKTLSWVRWVADHFGVPYSNRAIGGGSIQQMVYRIERDYHNGLIDDDDLVIVGVTSMFRWFQFDYTGHEMSWVFSFYESGIPKLTRELAENYINDYNILWVYHLHMNYLQKLADERKNIKLVHAIKAFSREKGYMESADLIPDFEKTLSSFEYPAVLIPYGISDLTAHLQHEQVTHGWGHPKIEFHKQYAKLIIDKLESLDD
jgi:hypothetical protein